jgi:hypothetical protein
MRMMPDFGNARDNEIAFDTAASYINNGDVEWGSHILTSLRDFIQDTQEAKSLHWILPAVVEALEYLDSGSRHQDSQYTRSVNDTNLIQILNL